MGRSRNFCTGFVSFALGCSQPRRLFLFFSSLETIEAASVSSIGYKTAGPKPLNPTMRGTIPSEALEVSEVYPEGRKLLEE